MSAVIIAESSHESVRQTMRNLKHPGERKLHWYDEQDVKRAKIAKAVGAMKLEAILVVRSQTQEREERKRRKCLERLLLELQNLEVARLTLESRATNQNKNDMNLVQALRSRKVLTPGPRVDHVPGPAEPLLWVADAMCGAHVSHRTGNSTYWSHVEATATVIEP